MFGFKPGELLTDLKKSEEEYHDLLDEQYKFKLESSRFISGRSDSEAVRDIGVMLNPPADLKTEAAKKTWIDRQKVENKELAEAYNTQRITDIKASDFEIRLKVLEMHMTNLRSQLAFRTSQFAYFAGNVLIEVDGSYDSNSDYYYVKVQAAEAARKAAEEAKLKEDK